MMAPQHSQARRVFMEMAELPEADRRPALDGACGGHAAFRAEVDAPIRAEQQAAGFMASPTGDVPPNSAAAEATVAAPLREGSGTKIGPYKILQQISEGGFGSVFMPAQEKPVQRRIAPKITKLGMDTKAEQLERDESIRSELKSWRAKLQDGP